METTSYTINSGKRNALYAHTLEEFINSGNSDKIPTYDTWCFVDNYNNIKFTVKNVLDDYLVELRNLATNVYFTPEDLTKYNYKPKLLSATLYGTTDLFYIILLMNGICNVKEFVNINPVKLIKKDDLFSFLSNIITGEKKNIEMYNNNKK